MTIDGVKASTVFAGVRKLVTISNPPNQHPDGAPPLSGTELSYSFFTARDQTSFERYLAGHEVELVYEE